MAIHNSNNNKLLLTEDGGFATRMTNRTGSASVKGTMVEASTLADGFTITDADCLAPIGVVFEDGVPDGEECLVTIAGLAYILLQDSTAATRGYWVRTSETQQGRIDATNAAPPGGTVQALEQHLTECGHCLETVTAGTDKLALILMHFN